LQAVADGDEFDVVAPPLDPLLPGQPPPRTSGLSQENVVTVPNAPKSAWP
jgi:hypothetical protein